GPPGAPHPRRTSPDGTRARPGPERSAEAAASPAPPTTGGRRSRGRAAPLPPPETSGEPRCAPPPVPRSFRSPSPDPPYQRVEPTANPLPGPWAPTEPFHQGGRGPVVPRHHRPADGSRLQHLVPPAPEHVQLWSLRAVDRGRHVAGSAPTHPEGTSTGEIGHTAEDRAVGVEKGEQVTARGVEGLGSGLLELHSRGAPAQRLEPEGVPRPQRRAGGADAAAFGQVGGEAAAAAGADEAVQGVGRGKGEVLLGVAAGMRAAEAGPHRRR